MFLQFEYAGIYMMRTLKNKINYILFYIRFSYPSQFQFKNKSYIKSAIYKLMKIIINLISKT